MKKCRLNSGIYLPGPPDKDGKPTSIPHFAGEEIDLPDELADQYDRSGEVDVLSHDGILVTWGSCCGGH